VETLLRNGRSQREIERQTGVDRKTIRRYGQALQQEPGANSPGVATGSEGRESGVLGEQNPPPWPPARPPKQARSACEEHREWIEQQVQLGRNAQSIYQDLVETCGFTHRYNSVKRFVRTLKARDPQRYDVLEYPVGEEAQVDFGQGAPTLYRNGKYRRPWLFVMTLKYSGKAFRKVVWKADQQTWARLHEEAFRAFGGSVTYVVPDFVAGNKIRHDDRGRCAIELQSAHMAREPVGQRLGAGRLRVCVAACAERTDEQLRAEGLLAVGAVDRYRAAGVIDEELLASEVPLAH
jgi:transposase